MRTDCGEENRGKEGDQFGYDKILAKEKKWVVCMFVVNRSQKWMLRSKEGAEGKVETREMI